MDRSDSVKRTGKTVPVAFHFEPDVEAADAGAAPTRRTPVGVVLVVVAIAVAGLAAFFTSGPSTSPGSQGDAQAPIVLRNAALVEWEALTPLRASTRGGFPEPMVSRTDGLCIGFGRVDFDVERRRPSLARCERNRPGVSAVANEIRTIVTVVSGLDTWQFLEAAGDVDGIRVVAADGRDIAAERIYLSGSTVALRLENDRPVESLRWTTPAGTFHCRSEPLAWQTGRFCAN